tara:strand:- start:52 stop:414 length:363 start_codon:yes stop_codon:yes gene_type:complete
MPTKNLTDLAYRVTQLKETEPPFSHHGFDKSKGLYKCICCENPLFSSTTKYESGSGWPSFYEPYRGNSIKKENDNSHGIKRIEVQCSDCHAHLGHVFEDGPPPTGLRFCINGVALKFEKD